MANRFVKCISDPISISDSWKHNHTHIRSSGSSIHSFIHGGPVSCTLFSISRSSSLCRLSRHRNEGGRSGRCETELVVLLLEPKAGGQGIEDTSRQCNPFRLLSPFVSCFCFVSPSVSYFETDGKVHIFKMDLYVFPVLHFGARGLYSWFRFFVTPPLGLGKG